MAYEERELVLNVHVNTDDVNPVITQLEKRLAAANKAIGASGNEAARGQDAATAATKRRTAANKDLLSSVDALSAKERKAVEEAIKDLKQHQKALEAFRITREQYERRLHEIETQNAVNQSRFRAGQIRKFEPIETPAAPELPAPPTSLRFLGQKDQATLTATAKAIVDKEVAADQALAAEVKQQRAARQVGTRAAKEIAAGKPQKLKDLGLETVDRDAFKEKVGVGKRGRGRPSNEELRAREASQPTAQHTAEEATLAATQRQVEASGEKATDAKTTAAEAVTKANDAETQAAKDTTKLAEKRTELAKETSSQTTRASNKLAVGDRVNLKAGDEKGGWGIVRDIVGDEFHIGMYGEETSARVFARSELTKPRQQTAAAPKQAPQPKVAPKPKLSPKKASALAAGQPAQGPELSPAPDSVIGNDITDLIRSEVAAAVEEQAPTPTISVGTESITLEQFQEKLKAVQGPPAEPAKPPAKTPRPKQPRKPRKAAPPKAAPKPPKVALPVDDGAGAEPPPDDVDLLDIDEPSAPRAIGGRRPLELPSGPQKATFSPAVQRVIQMTQERIQARKTASPRGPFAQQPRERQRRDRYNAKRKEQRGIAREQKALGQQMLELFSQFQLPDRGQGYEEPDFEDRFSEILPGERVGEFMDRLRYQARKAVRPYTPGSAKQPQLGSGKRLELGPGPRRVIALSGGPRGPFPRPGGDAADADSAADELFEDEQRRISASRLVRGTSLLPNIPGSILPPPTPAATTRGKRGSGSGGSVNVPGLSAFMANLKKLSAQFDDTGKHKDGFMKNLGALGGVFQNLGGQASGLGGGTTASSGQQNQQQGQPGGPTIYPANTGDPAQDAKQSRANKDAYNADAARAKKDQAQDDRDANKTIKDAQADTARDDRNAKSVINDYARDTAHDNHNSNRVINDFKEKASAANQTNEVRQNAQHRQNVNDQKVDQARANADSARARARAAQIRADDVARSTARRARLDAEADKRGTTRPDPFPRGLFSGIAFSTNRFLGSARRPIRDFSDRFNREGSNYFSGPLGRMVNERAGFGNRLGNAVTNASGNNLSGLFNPVKFFGNLRSEFTKTKGHAEGFFKSVEAGFKRAFGDEFGGKSFQGFAKSFGPRLSEFADGLTQSFSGIGKTLFSFRGLIIAGLAALGPLVAMLGSLAAGALGAANALVQLAGTALVLPSLFAAAATAIGALVTAISPLSSILSAYAAKQKAANTATDSGVTTAERARRAQEDLNKVRRDAARALQDLQTQVSRADLTENGAILNVKQARQRYLETLADPNSTVLDQQLAFQGYQESQASLQDTRTQNTRNKEDLATLPAENQQKIADAQKLVNAGGDQATASADADLKRQLNNAGPATQAFALGLAKIFLDAGGPWKRTQKAVAEGLFKPLVPELGNIQKLLGPLGTLLSKAAGALGTIAAQAIEKFSSPEWTQFFNALADVNVAVIKDFGAAALSFAEGFKSIMEAVTAPLLDDGRSFLEWFTEGIANLAKKFASWASEANKNGGIGDFLKQVMATLRDVGGIVGNVFGAFKNLFVGSNDFTRDFLGTLVLVTQKFEDWSKSAADPNSGFRRFLADTMPLLKQLGGLVVDVVKAFFQIASDPKNIAEAKRILTALTETVLPAIVEFFTNLSNSQVVSKLADAFGKFVQAVSSLLEHGGGTALRVFITGMDWLVSVLNFFIQFPAVAHAITGIAIALSLLAATALFMKFTGLAALLRGLQFLLTNKNDLQKIFKSIGGFFSGKGFGSGGSSSTGGGSTPTTGGGGGGAATSELGELQALNTKMATVIGLLERIEVCVCRKTPCTCTTTPSTSTTTTTGAATMTTAAEQLIIAARELMVAGAILSGRSPTAITAVPSVRTTPTALPVGSTAKAIPATVGEPIIAGETVAAGAAVGGGAAAAAASKTGLLSKLGKAGGKAAILALIASIVYPLIAPLFQSDTQQVDPTTGEAVEQPSWLDQQGGATGLAITGLSAGLVLPSLLPKGTASRIFKSGQSGLGSGTGSGNFLSKMFSGLRSSSSKSTVPNFNLGDVDAAGYAKQTNRASMWSRILNAAKTPAAEKAEGSVFSRILPRVARPGLANPLTAAGTIVGIAADTIWTGKERQTPAAQLARAGGAVLTGAGLGAPLGPAGIAVGAIAGGAYSIAKDPGLRKTIVNNPLISAPLSPVAYAASALLQKDKKGDTRAERIWDGAYEGFMRNVGSPVAKFFRESIPKAAGSVRDFFTKTIPAHIQSGLVKPVHDFFTKTLPSLPDKIIQGITYIAGRAEVFFVEQLPKIVRNFFTKTLPDLGRDAWRLLKRNIFDPIGDFFSKTLPRVAKQAWHGITEFFTETLPRAARQAWHAITTFFTSTLPAAARRAWSAITTFFTETLPRVAQAAWDGIVTFFTETLPSAAEAAWHGISSFFTETLPRAAEAAWNGITTFFTETLPNAAQTAWNGIVTFFTETLPGAIMSLPGLIYDNVIQPIIGFFSGIPAAIGDFFSGTWDAITKYVEGFWDRLTKNNTYKRGQEDQRNTGLGKQSGGLIEGTYDGRVDTKIVPLTIGEFVARKRVVDKPMGKMLLTDLNEERFDPADFYAGLNRVTQAANVSVSLPKMSLAQEKATSITNNSTTNNNRGGHQFGDVHIHNPVREKSDVSMRRTLHKLAYLSER